MFVEYPLVSVVIPTHNSAGTINTAVASLEAQTYRGFQVVIVDDASTDATPVILKHRFDSHPDYDVLLLPENGGPARARNRAIAQAAGEWLAFLDADDAWLPDKLQVQLEQAKANHDVALWCGTTIPFTARSADSAFRACRGVVRRGGRSRIPRSALDGRDEMPPGNKQHNNFACRKIRLEEFITENPVATSTVLVKRDALEAVGGFDEQFCGPEDYDLWMRIVQAYPAMLINKPLSRYRYTPGSLSMNDCTFLPQVLRVLDKAFGDGGALEQYREFRESAVSNQLWNASWMAFHRGARGTAVRYWWRAWRMNQCSRRPISRAWLRLLARYVFGRPQA